MLELMETKWRKLATSFVKVNVDFAAFTSIEYDGTSVIIRDEHGQFVEAKFKDLWEVYSHIWANFKHQNLVFNLLKNLD